MRIAMLSWESLHSVAVGGVAAHVTELAAALQRKGHEVHVFTRMAPTLQQYDLIDGVHYHRCGFRLCAEFVDEVNDMCRSFVGAVFGVENQLGPFDVIHAHDWLAANALIWIKQGRGRKGVLTIHSTEYARCGNTFPNGRSHRIRHQERAGTYWADRVIAVSQATKEEIEWMYEVPDWKTEVVYNGVSPQRFDIQIDQGAVKRQYAIGPVNPTILFCGRLTCQKGPDLLLDCVPGILRQHPRAKFVFAGDGDMRGELEARAARMGVRDGVRFLGHRNGDELIRLFKMADTVCIPSRNEPFGIVVLEAWSARKPVVVTKVGGPNEYVWHEVNGLKISPNAGSISWGLEEIFKDFERARWMGDNGRIAVDTSFHWDHIADQVLDVYNPDEKKLERAAEAARPTAAVAAPAIAYPARRIAPAERLPLAAQVEPRRIAAEIERRELAAVAASLASPIAGADSPSQPMDHERSAADLAACQQALIDPAIITRLRPDGLEIEGPWDKAWATANRCQRTLRWRGKVCLTIAVKAGSEAAQAGQPAGAAEPAAQSAHVEAPVAATEPAGERPAAPALASTIGRRKGGGTRAGGPRREYGITHPAPAAAASAATAIAEREDKTSADLIDARR